MMSIRESWRSPMAFVLKLAGIYLLGLAFLVSQTQAQNQYLSVRTDGCAGIRTLDFLQLQNLVGADGGKVTVRTSIDAAGTAHAHVLVSAERSGPEAFWNQVANTLNSWCFSPQAVAGGFLDYTVVVNPQSQGGGGYIEISAKNLVLAEGWDLDIAHGERLAYVQNVDVGNIMITESPPTIHAAGPAGFWGSVKAVIGHLNTGFQIAFAILVVLLLVAEVAVWLTGAQSWVKPGFSLRRTDEQKQILASIRRDKPKDEDEAKELRENFGSWEARDVRNRWIRAMEVAQLESNTLPPIQPETVDSMEELTKFALHHARNGGEIYDKAKELDLVGRGKILDPRDFQVAAASGEEDLDALRDRALAKAKELLDMDALLEAAPLIKKASSVEELTRALSRYDIRLEENGAAGGDKAHTDTRGFSEIRKIISEKTEWAKLYLRNLESGLPSLSDEEERRLRVLTWEYFAKGLVKAAHDKAARLAKAGIDLFEVFEAGLSNHLVNRNEWWSSQEIDRSVDRSLSVKLETRKSALDSLWAIGAIAPLIGLFGTVWGISAAFGKIQNIQEAQLRMAKLSGDINVALSTTIVGLVIGIIAFLTYYWYKGRIEHMGAEVAKYFTDITNRA